MTTSGLRCKDLSSFLTKAQQVYLEQFYNPFVKQKSRIQKSRSVVMTSQDQINTTAVALMWQSENQNLMSFQFYYHLRQTQRSALLSQVWLYSHLQAVETPQELVPGLILLLQLSHIWITVAHNACLGELIGDSKLLGSVCVSLLLCPYYL